MRSYVSTSYLVALILVLGVIGLPIAHADNNPFVEIDLPGLPSTVVISTEMPGDAPAATTAPGSPVPAPAAATPPPSRTYRVVSGDYLWKIAARFLGDGSRYWEIVELNKHRYPSIAKNPNLIYPGWEFILPGDAGNTGTTTTKPGAPPSSTFGIVPPRVSPPPTGAKGGKALLGWLQQAGLSGEMMKMAWAIGMAESGGRPNALNDNPRTGDLSYGLFQINMIRNLGPARVKQLGLSSYDDLFDPLTNIRAMLKISSNGTNWKPWSVFKTGAYRKFYDSYPPR